MKKLLVGLTMLFVLFGMTACSDAEGSDGDKMTIYFLSKTLGNQYWSIVEQGAKDAAAELGVEVVIQGLNNESEIEKQVQQLQDAVSAGADAIIMGPVDSEALASHVSETFQSGIPMIMVDTMINTDDFTAALLTDNKEAGRLAAEEMIRLFEQKGISKDEEAVVAVQIPTSGSQTVNDRVDGFNEYWLANAPSNWKFLTDEIKLNDGDITKATTIAQDYFTAHPDKLKGVFGPNNGSTVGFVTAIKEASRTDLVMVGFDFSDEIAELVKSDDYLVSSVVQRQYFMGYEGVKLAYELANGGTVEQKVVDTGVMIVTGENVDSDEVQEIINPTGN